MILLFINHESITQVNNYIWNNNIFEITFQHVPVGRMTILVKSTIFKTKKILVFFINNLS